MQGYYLYLFINCVIYFNILPLPFTLHIHFFEVRDTFSVFVKIIKKVIIVLYVYY